MLKLKIIVAGDKSVGKTSLIRRFCTGRFEMDTISTIGVDFMVKNIRVGDREIHLSLWDFAGEHKFRILFPSYCTGASGALILYDITNKRSFENLKEWLDLINKSAGNIVKILIGSKKDLEDKREVPAEEAIKFKEENGLDLFLETSAKTGEGVEDAFIKLGEFILEKSLTKCPECGKMVPKEILFCTYCGAKIQK